MCSGFRIVNPYPLRGILRYSRATRERTEDWRGAKVATNMTAVVSGHKDPRKQFLVTECQIYKSKEFSNKRGEMYNLT